MRGTIFYTQFSVPHNMTVGAYRDMITFFRKQRSISQVLELPRAVYLVAGGSFTTLRHSDCPLPGSHDFAAGWLAHEAMMEVARFVGQPLAWFEGEIYQAQLSGRDNQVTLYPARRGRGDKPMVVVGPNGVQLPKESWTQAPPLSQGGQITGPGQP